MKILRKTLAMVTALMMICGCVTAHAADVTTPQKISSDTVLDVDGGIIITDVTDEFALDIDGNSSGEIKAEVAVSEDIAARETGAGGSFTGAVNIETGYESTAGVEAGRDLIATSVSDGVQVTGLAINAGEASAVNIGAGNGDLVVTAKGDDAPAIGMEITTGHSASADVNIGAEGGGGISVETAGVNSLAAGVRLLSGKESSIDVTVGDGGILSSAAAGEATGLEAETEGEGAAIVSVGKGGISAQTEGDSYNVQGVYASASEMGKVSIESKEGDVSAVAGGEAEARGIGAHASDNSGVAVMVQNVSAEAPKGTQAFGVSVGTYGDDPLAYVDVAGDVSVVGSENESESKAVEIENEGGTVMMNVDGDINAKEARSISIINDTDVSGAAGSLTQMKVGGDIVSQNSGYSVGVHMGTGNGNDRIEADYNGSVIVTGDTGSGVSMSGDGGTIEATVGKDISVDMKDNAVGVDTEYDNDLEESLTVLGSIDVNSANDDAYGINTMGSGTGTQTFTVSGDVSVNAPKGTAYGVSVDAASGSSELDITIKGNLSVKGVDDPGHCSSGASFYNGGSKVSLDVGGDIGAVNGDGIEITNQGESASSTVTVGGNIEVEGAQPNVGILIENMGDNAQARVDVGGGVSVNNDNHARGIAIDATSGDVEVNVGNEVTAVAKYDDAEAIDLYTNTDTVVSVTAAGPVTAITEDEAGAAIGIHVNPSSGAGEVYVSAKDGVSAENTAGGSATAIQVEHMHVLPAATLRDESVVDVYVQGDVTSTGTGIYVQTEEEGKGSVHVLVDEGNVEADSTGIFLMGNQTMDVLVDGTVHGGNSSVLVEGTVSDMTLTVWEIKPDDEGHYAERVDWLPEDPGPSTWEDEELCKEIQYIIRVQPNDHATLTAEGTTDYEGYQVAHEDDKVVLKIDIQPGYQLEGAFGNADQNIELKRDDEGNYYLVVPRGGGVLLGVKLSKILPAKKKLTVTFDPNGGVLRGSTEPFTTSVEKDGTLTLPEAPENDGSVFLGWYCTPYSAQDPRWSAPEAGSDELKPAGAEVTVTDTVFYTAVWQANE